MLLVVKEGPKMGLRRLGVRAHLGPDTQVNPIVDDRRLEVCDGWPGRL